MLKLEKIQLIRNRRRKLQEAGKRLKKHFVGLDEVIDRILSHIESWYVMPEIITRPVIVNLWGMTGVGKTDLVRRLVKYLDFEDRFVEIQMEGQGGVSWDEKSVRRKLMYSSIEEGEPGILLMDEIQRFRTVNEDGKDCANDKYQDFWTLLSDGRFNTEGDGKSILFELLAETLYEEEMDRVRKCNNDGDPEDGLPKIHDVGTIRVPKKKKNKKDRVVSRYKMQYFSARHFRRTLRRKESISDIMTWNFKRRLNLIYERLDDNNGWSGPNYSNLLIFVSGNIDEAYAMSSDADDADTDADVFHERSKMVDMVVIKGALRERFRPEQISRFGNTHVIYPALSRCNYETIISKRIDEIVESVYERWKVKVMVDSTVRDAIYRNGVFPAQGVRPVLTTVSGIFESTLSKFILIAFEDNRRKVDVVFKNGKMVGIIGPKEIVVPVECALDNIRFRQSSDKQYLLAIHEAAHAIVYALLFDSAPTQIRIGTLTLVSGFMSGHHTVGSKQQILDHIAVLLSGSVAEEIIFGEKMRTRGGSTDHETATHEAAVIIRRTGLGPLVSSVFPGNPGPVAADHNTDIESTNPHIETMLQAERKRAATLLRAHLGWLKSVSDELIDNRGISPERFVEISKVWCGKELPIHKAREELCPPYGSLYEKFWTCQPGS